MAIKEEELPIERDASQLVPVGNTGPAITGVKYEDLNTNGSRDANEPAIGGVSIFIDANRDGIRQTNEPLRVTDSSGNFRFDGVPVGQWVVREIVPAGFRATTPESVLVTLNNRDVAVSFGNTRTGSLITGCKFLDLDADGFRDGNEPPIEGVRIFIDDNNDNIWQATERFTYTDRNGNWQFGALAPGLYRIREDRVTNPPVGPLERNFPQTTPPAPFGVPNLDINLGANEIWSCATVGNTRLYTIPIQKFADTNRNGQRDTNEQFLENVPFILDLNRDGRWQQGSEPIALSDANGNARFTDLLPGSYSLLEIFPGTLPAGTRLADGRVLSAPLPLGNINFPVSTTSNPVEIQAPGPQAVGQGTVPVIATVPDSNVFGGTRIIRVNFSESFPPSNPQASVTFSPVPPNPTPSDTPVGNVRPSITVFKYNDLNGNGRFDPTTNNAEAGINGVQVYIDLNDNGTPDSGEPTRTTDNNGRTVFNNLPAGNYVVREVVPSGFSATMPTRVSFALNNQDANVVFGNAPNSTIVGCKFEDLNSNGYRDGNERGVSGVTIYIDANGNDTLDANEVSTTSDQFGQFRFTNLTAGLYRIREVVPAGANQTSQKVDVSLGVNQVFGCVLVGNGLQYDLRVPKFNDLNRNGVRDSGEPPLANIPFILDLNRNGRQDAGEPQALTNSEGIATFSGLAPGRYSVLEIFPPSNPFPIPTGPNPQDFVVPGPNTVRSAIVTTRTGSELDPLTEFDLLDDGRTASVTSRDSLLDLSGGLPSASGLDISSVGSSPTNQELFKETDKNLILGVKPPNSALASFNI